MRSPDGGPAAPSGRAPSPELGLPVLALLGLVMLAVPRAIAHDLDLVPPGGLANALLALVPLVIWVAVAVRWSKRPLASLLAAGLGYGLALAVVHNLAWHTSFAEPPRLGGSLSGVFSGFTEQVLMRGAASISSIATGLLVGLVSGVIALAVQRSLRSRASVRHVVPK